MEQLRELTAIRQNPGEHIRRVFFNDQTELIIWYSDLPSGKISGLQFSYGDFSHDQVIRWFIGKPVSFTMSDEAKFMKSTLLKANDAFIYQDFLKKYPDILEKIPIEAKPAFDQMLRLLHENKYVRHADIGG